MTQYKAWSLEWTGFPRPQALPISAVHPRLAAEDFAEDCLWDQESCTSYVVYVEDPTGHVTTWQVRMEVKLVVTAAEVHGFAPDTVVTVYEDPITETRRECEARVVRCIETEVAVIEGRTLRRYELDLYPNEGGFIERTILDPKEPS